MRQGKKEETLCIVSVRDEREQQQVRLVCFGTVNAKTGGLETFHLSEQTRYWEQQLAKDHLGLLYERQFKKLGSASWQEAFTTSEEREQAEKLLKVCSKKSPTIKEIQENVLTLLDTIAKGFGLRKKAGHLMRMQAFDLPADHDIGVDPEELAKKHAGKNPFGGVTLRDEKNRLLGYIVYPLKRKEDAVQLRKYLEKNNRFHNVLVVFPDGDETTLELWQGTDQLSGKLRKDHGFHGAAEVVSLLSRFFVVSKAKVRNPSELAQELAYRARYLRRLAIKELDVEKEDGPIRDLYKAFKETLVHDQTESEFADAFAQTLTYGLLTARWIGNDNMAEAGDRFTRQNAMNYLPPTSNFLKDLFKTALSVKLNDQRGRLLWLIDDIADLLDRIDVVYVFGAGDKNNDQVGDPVIHFYEPFLKEYDNEIKVQRGVFFTPRPAVSYIVRGVHELLQTAFGLEDGLASTATWGDILKKIPKIKLPDGVCTSQSFVSILDIATGTGTFLYECVEVIEQTMKEKWCKDLKKDTWSAPEILALWQDYVSKHLLTRLHGYEVMMASYSIAHLKMAFKLGETGYKFTSNDRIHIYLTNSLEPASDTQKNIVGVLPSLAKEAQEVNTLKNSQRFTVVIGNPPYAVNSANKNSPIDPLLSVYKSGLDGERNLKPINDDYVKFILFSQLRLSDSQVGIIGMITNNSFTTERIFRSMRRSLMDNFSQINFLDLRGEVSRDPNMKDDKNIFEIQQGVGISLLTKIPQTTGSSSVMIKEITGSAETKFDWLNSNTVSTTPWMIIVPKSDLYCFQNQSEPIRLEYQSMLPLNKIFKSGNVGYQTHRDAFVIDIDENSLVERISSFRQDKSNEYELSNKYGIKSNRDWSIIEAHKQIKKEENVLTLINKTLYRPFDIRSICYASYLIDYDRGELMRNMLSPNIGLLVSKSYDEHEFTSIFITKYVVESKVADRTRGSYLFPLRITESGSQMGIGLPGISNLNSNFDERIIKLLSKELNSKIEISDSYGLNKKITDRDVLNYIYALLHSPSYRSRYSEFLKSDFPHIPFTSNREFFCALGKLGSELIAFHLSDSLNKSKWFPKFVGKGDNSIPKRPVWKNDAVWINSTQHFENVPEIIWNFHIGGYQVCDKWLKDRKGLVLSIVDIAHYQNIIVAISETIRLMAEIDKVIDAYSGWPGAFQSSNGGAK